MKKKIITSVVALVLVIGALGIYYGSGWSKINCWTKEIDINSGETRFQRYWFWIITADKIEHTWLSKLLEVPDKQADRNWQLVEILSPGRSYSPLYAYGQVLTDLRLAQDAFSNYGVEKEEKLRLAKEIRTAWLENEDGQEASRLIREFCIETEENAASEKLNGKGALPGPSKVNNQPDVKPARTGGQNEKPGQNAKTSPESKPESEGVGIQDNYKLKIKLPVVAVQLPDNPEKKEEIINTVNELKKELFIINDLLAKKDYKVMEYSGLNWTNIKLPKEPIDYRIDFGETENDIIGIQKTVYKDMSRNQKEQDKGYLIIFNEPNIIKSFLQPNKGLYFYENGQIRRYAMRIKDPIWYAVGWDKDGKSYKEETYDGSKRGKVIRTLVP